MTTRYETCLLCAYHMDGTCLQDGNCVEAHVRTAGCPLHKFDVADPPGLPEPLTVGAVVRGAVGVAKSFFHMDAPADPVVAEREAACGVCPANGDGVCRICHCNVWSKARVASETCPWGKWASAPAPAGQGSPAHQ